MHIVPSRKTYPKVHQFLRLKTKPYDTGFIEMNSDSATTVWGELSIHCGLSPF